MLTSFASACPQRGIILHELGHVLGLYHEQSRADRNDHIKVNVHYSVAEISQPAVRIVSI